MRELVIIFYLVDLLVLYSSLINICSSSEKINWNLTSNFLQYSEHFLVILLENRQIAFYVA